MLICLLFATISYAVSLLWWRIDRKPFILPRKEQSTVEEAQRADKTDLGQTQREIMQARMTVARGFFSNLNVK